MRMTRYSVKNRHDATAGLARRCRPAALILSLLLVIAATAGSAAHATPIPDEQPVIVTFVTADGSTFRAEIAQPADIAAVRAALAGDGYAGIPIGSLAPGDGGVNAPHEWHMVETTIAEVTIELCDGTASMVDEDVTYWVETVGRFCPWSATVAAIEPVAPGGGEEPAEPTEEPAEPTEEPGDGGEEPAVPTEEPVNGGGEDTVGEEPTDPGNGDVGDGDDDGQESDAPGNGDDGDVTSLPDTGAGDSAARMPLANASMLVSSGLAGLLALAFVLVQRRQPR